MKRSDAGRITVPLAWRNLTASKKRFAASLAGTAFAVTLMFVEMGFRNVLMDSMPAILHRLDGQLMLIGRSVYSVFVPRPFPARRLEQAGTFKNVVGTAPFYIEPRLLKWRRVSDGMPQRIRVLAYRPEDDILNIEGVRRQRHLLTRRDTALADQLSKFDLFGTLAAGTVSELGSRETTIVGEYNLGTDFQNHGNLVVSEDTFLEHMPQRRGNSIGDRLIDVGVIQVAPGTDLEQLRTAIQERLPNDVVVLTRDGLVQKEQQFWERVTPIGIVFNIGVFMGFLIGLIVCYQVLYAEIDDHLAEFATLKAMGYSEGWLFRVILQEAMYLATLGYAAGMGMSGLLFSWIHQATGLPMMLDPAHSVAIYLLTAIMCATAAGLAARKLIAANPADLFR